MKIQMYLVNSKVWKYSRQVGNSFIVKLPITARRECGLRWQEFGKKWVRDEQFQQIEVQLKRIKGNLWELDVPMNLQQPIKEHLYNQYGR